jgi:hypothetical protein
MPIAWAAAIGVAGSLASSAIQAGGQQTAADTQTGMFNTIVGQEQPFISAGGSASKTLSELTGGAPATGAGGTAAGTGLPGGYLTQTFDPTQANLENYPGYKFQLDQGDLALNSANSAGGSALSGPALKSLMTFNQGLAASNYQNYFNQFQTQQNNIFNRLNGIATMGQNAAGNLGTNSATLGSGIASAQASAAGSIAGGIAGASNNIGQSILLSNLMNNGGGGTGGTPNYGTGTMPAGGGYTYNTGYGGD